MAFDPRLLEDYGVQSRVTNLISIFTCIHLYESLNNDLCQKHFSFHFCSHTEEGGVGGTEEDGEAGVTPAEGGAVGVTHIITIIITTLEAGVVEGAEVAGSQEGVTPPLEEGEEVAAGSPQAAVVEAIAQVLHLLADLQVGI